MFLLDEDAYVVGLSYFPPTMAPHLTPKLVQATATTAGVQLPKKGNLKALLTALGHELYII